MKKTNYFIMMVFLALSIVSCSEDDPMNPTGSFTVTIQNVFEGKEYFNSGTTDGIPPGEDFTFSFQAGKGHRLSFTTMFVQSNDLFYAPSQNGITLYDDMGNPVTGDVTDKINLWDAGTEVNQEPGVGPDQAPRQTGENTGTDENGTVILVSDVNDGFSYPANEAVIKVVIEHDGKTKFTVTLSNVSDLNNFQTPLAPGVWVVHSTDNPLFESGVKASNELEALAEDGANSMLNNELMQNAGYVSPFAPGIWAVHNNSNPVFTIGQSASSELEALAEDGDPAGFISSLDGITGIRSFNVFTTPAGGSSPAPIFPAEQYTFEFDAEAGDKLSLATMLVQSNDLFVGGEIELFQNGSPITGDITSQLQLLDAKTEINQFPGAGNDQAPRQSGANTGASETGSISEVNDSFEYPAITQMIKVSISSN